jgi:hypothetical protein
MLVNRRTFVVKRGHMDEVVALIQAEMKRTNDKSRIYVSETGSFDTIAGEWEFESLAEYEKGWAEYFATPEATTFLQKWNELTETGGTNEIWTLVE